MAECRTCKAVTTRIRTKFIGKWSVDECPTCAPQAFEAIKDPSTKKIWIGPEFAPNDYEMVNGVPTMKPEAVAELEAKSCGIKSVAAQEELAATERAIEEKRKTRRTKPLSQAEIEKALSWIDRTLRPMIEDTETSYEV